MQCIKSLTNTLKEVAVIVEALLTVALVARQCVLTAALLTDFISKQRTLVDICGQERNNLPSVIMASVVRHSEDSSPYLMSTVFTEYLDKDEYKGTVFNCDHFKYITEWMFV